MGGLAEVEIFKKGEWKCQRMKENMDGVLFALPWADRIDVGVFLG